jgi:hypothetical protein
MVTCANMQPATFGRPTARAAFAGRMSAPVARGGAVTGSVRRGARVSGSVKSDPTASGARRPAFPARRKRASVRPRAGYSHGESISPDLTHTEEAFSVNLDRVAVGAYVSVSVRADVAADAGVDALVAVVHAHMPGDIYVHWGLGSEAEDGSISADAWECPPPELMPPGSRRVSNWASGAAVQSPIDPHSGTVEIPLPSRPGHGLAFVLYDAERQCYFDHDGSAFFLDSSLSSETARRATAAAAAAARHQETRVRAIAEAEAAETARQHAEMSRRRDEDARAREERERQTAEARAREEREEADGKAAYKAAAKETARQNAIDEAAASARRKMAAEKEAAYQQQLRERADEVADSVYARFIADEANPFRDFAPSTAAKARGETVRTGTAEATAATATAAPPKPPPGFVNPNAVDPALAAGLAAFAPSFKTGGGGSGWDGASSSAATDHSYEPPPPPAPSPKPPTSVAVAPAVAPAASASGSLVASHTIPLTTESGSSTGTCEVSVMATWPPSVRIECRAGGAAEGHPLLLHWGVSDRRGGTWMSPYDQLANVPEGSRAPDAQSCESALENGVRVVEFAPHNAGATCMTMLIRTEDCKEWLRETSGGDVFIDVSPALEAVRAMGPPDGAQQHEQQRQH